MSCFQPNIITVEQQATLLVCYLLKWFYDTFTGVATGAARCGSFVGGAQIARELAIWEYGGHED
jgi:hypothetical protein